MGFYVIVLYTPRAPLFGQRRGTRGGWISELDPERDTINQAPPLLQNTASGLMQHTALKPKPPNTRLLGGSWVVTTGVISPLITTVTLLITPLITTHEPPSKDPKHKKPPQHPVKRARFQADEDLGFPELEIRWNPELLVRDFVLRV